MSGPTPWPPRGRGEEGAGVVLDEDRVPLLQILQFPPPPGPVLTTPEGRGTLGGQRGAFLDHCTGGGGGSSPRWENFGHSLPAPVGKGWPAGWASWGSLGWWPVLCGGGGPSVDKRDSRERGEGGGAGRGGRGDDRWKRRHFSTTPGGRGSSCLTLSPGIPGGGACARPREGLGTELQADADVADDGVKPLGLQRRLSHPRGEGCVRGCGWGSGWVGVGLYGWPGGVRVGGLMDGWVGGRVRGVGGWAPVKACGGGKVLIHHRPSSFKNLDEEKEGYKGTRGGGGPRYLHPTPLSNGSKWTGYVPSGSRTDLPTVNVLNGPSGIPGTGRQRGPGRRVGGEDA